MPRTLSGWVACCGFSPRIAAAAGLKSVRRWPRLGTVARPESAAH